MIEKKERGDQIFNFSQLRGIEGLAEGRKFIFDLMKSLQVLLAAIGKPDRRADPEPER